MRTKIKLLAASLLASGLVVLPVQAGNNPVDENWWPGEFGANDEIGAANHITPQKRLDAVKLVKRGKTATLGMPYSNHMPLVPGRTFTLSIPSGSNETIGPLPWPGDNFDQSFFDEIVTAEIGQVGTQWDGLAHGAIRVQGASGWKDGLYFYNGVRAQDIGTSRGFKKNGSEKQPGFFTRGILIDIAALKGVKRLQKGYAITVADYKAALQRQGIQDAGPGDVVLIRTGWNSLWKTNHLGRPAGDKVKSDEQLAKDLIEAGDGEAGAHPELCDFLATKKISMIGSDTWALEAFPPVYPESTVYCHMNLLVRRGITNFENLDLDQLSEDKAYEFLFTWAPLKLVGATGSPGNPLAAY
ncbi:MAG: cyclase family protein [Prolixibacteraceae bacterium]|nr:cyclase family protein [Burkholderiales bacterium]